VSKKEEMCLKFNECFSFIRSSSCIQGVEMFCDLFLDFIKEELKDEKIINQGIKEIFLKIFREKIKKALKEKRMDFLIQGSGFSYKETCGTLFRKHPTWPLRMIFRYGKEKKRKEIPKTKAWWHQ